MKKYSILVVLATTVLLAGCGDKGQNMTFDEAYTAFGKQFSSISIPKIDITTAQASTTDITVALSSQQGTSASGHIILSGEYEGTSGGSTVDMIIKGSAYEPSLGSNMNINGLLRFVSNAKNMYGYIDTFSIAPATGDVDGGIIGAIVGTISKKWIQLNSGDVGNIPGYRENALSLVTHLQEALHTYPLFKSTEKTTIDGHAAYALVWNPEGVSGFVQYLLQDAKNPGTQVTFSGDTIQEVTKGILESPLVGYLIINTSDDIELRIDSLKTKDVGDLALSISTRGITMKVSDLEDKSTIITGDAHMNTDGVVFSLSVPTNKLTVQGKSEDNMKKWSIDMSTPEANLIVHTDTTMHPIDVFTPIQVGTSVSLSQILQGFNLLGGGGNNDTGSEETAPTNSTP